VKTLRTLLVVVSLLAFTACDSAQQCQKLFAYRADETRSCLQPPQPVPELLACTTEPLTRGVRIVCLVDRANQLYVATTSDSAQLSGTGWRYTGGAGDQQLSALESQRCADFLSRVGFPEPAKQCGP